MDVATNTKQIDSFAAAVLNAGAALSASTAGRLHAHVRRRYEDSWQRLFESCLFRYIDGHRVPGAMGCRLVEEMDRLEVDTFEALQRAIEKWDQQRPFVPFLRAVMTNAMRDKYRKQRVSVGASDVGDESDAERAEPASAGAPGGAGGRPMHKSRFVELSANAASDDDPAVAAEVRQAFRNCVDVFAGAGSSYPDIAILLLHEFSELSYENLSAMMNEELQTLGDAAAGRMRPFYLPATLRKRAERLRASLKEELGGDTRLQEAIRVLSDADGTPSRGRLPEFAVRRIVGSAVERLRDVNSQAGVVEATVRTQGGVRDMLRRFEADLSGAACREMFTPAEQNSSGFGVDSSAMKLYNAYVTGEYNIEDPLPDWCLGSADCQIFKLVAASLVPPQRPWDRMILSRNTQIDTIPMWKLLDNLEYLHGIPQRSINNALLSVDGRTSIAELRKKNCFDLGARAEKYFSSLRRCTSAIGFDGEDADNDVYQVYMLYQCDQAMRRIRWARATAFSPAAERRWRKREDEALEKWDKWFDLMSPNVSPTLRSSSEMSTKEREALSREVFGRVTDLRSLLDCPA